MAVSRRPPLRLVPEADEVPTPTGLVTAVERAALGDPQAREALYRGLARFVGQVLRAGGAHPSELEDLVHDTFLEAFSSLETLERPEALRAWMARLAMRQLQRRRRWRPWLRLFGSRREEAQAWEELLDASASAEVVAEVSRAARLLQQCAAEDSLAWRLHRWHELTLEETASACAVSLATLKRRVARIDAFLARWREDSP